jgi:hypothetical protein
MIARIPVIRINKTNSILNTKEVLNQLYNGVNVTFFRFDLNIYNSDNKINNIIVKIIKYENKCNIPINKRIKVNIPNPIINAFANL